MKTLAPIAAACGAPHITLPAWGLRAVSIQGALLVAAALVLPAATHAAGIAGSVVLPMHWPVLVAGLCYGWRSGLLLGLASPLVSYALSGMPFPAILPAMTVELACYGVLAGFAREVLRWHPLAATVAAVIGGRAAFVAVVCQILLVPPVSSWWVGRERG